MATCIWDGSKDGNWADVDNWDTRVPLDNDIVMFEGTPANVPSTNLDQGAIDVDLLYIAEDFANDLGASGNRLEIAADKIIHRGTGCLWLTTSSDAAHNIDLLVINSKARGTALDLIGGANGTVTTLSVARGKASVGGTVAITNVILHYETSPLVNADVTIATSGLITNILQSGGHLTLTGISPTSVYISGGEMTLTGQPAIATFVLANGFVDWQTDAKNCAITTLHLMGGTIDARQAGEWTITNYYKHAGGEGLFNSRLLVVNEYDLSGDSY